MKVRTIITLNLEEGAIKKKWKVENKWRKEYGDEEQKPLLLKDFKAKLATGLPEYVADEVMPSSRPVEGADYMDWVLGEMD